MSKPLGRLKLSRPLVFFDLETTGVDTDADKIVEFAAEKFGVNGESIGALVTYVNPGRPIPAESTAVHHITDEMVKDAPPFRQVMQTVLDFMKNCDFAGYNIRKFDIALLAAEFHRCGVDFWPYVKDACIIDSCDIFFAREPRSLAGAMRFYCGRSHEDAHSAIGDVAATFAVLAAQLENYPDLPSSLEELAEICADKDVVDMAGKLRWIGNDVCINFGKHRGTPLRLAPPDYLRWMSREGVIGRDCRHIIEKAIKREFLSRTKSTETKTTSER